MKTSIFVFLVILFMALFPAFVFAGSTPGDFQVIYKKIIDQKCVGCHDKTGFKGVDLSTYETILGNKNGLVVPFEPESSSFFTVVRDGEMPLGDVLPRDELALIYRWIKNGARQFD